MPTALWKHAKCTVTLAAVLAFSSMICMIFTIMTQMPLYSEILWEAGTHQLDDFLGELTSKFPFDEQITALILSGPKTYSYSQPGESLL